MWLKVLLPLPPAVVLVERRRPLRVRESVKRALLGRAGEEKRMLILDQPAIAAASDSHWSLVHCFGDQGAHVTYARRMAESLSEVDEVMMVDG